MSLLAKRAAAFSAASIDAGTGHLGSLESSASAHHPRLRLTGLLPQASPCGSWKVMLDRWGVWRSEASRSTSVHRLWPTPREEKLRFLGSTLPRGVETISCLRMLGSRSFASSSRSIEERLKADPDNPNLIVEHALGLQEQNCLEEAEQAYLRALELAPHNIAALYNYGTFLISTKGDFVAAEELYLRCIKFIPPGHASLAGIYTNYAVVMQTYHQNTERAEQLLEKAVNIDPQHSEALATWAQLIMEECIHRRKQEERRRLAGQTEESDEHEDGSDSVSVEERENKAEGLFRRAIVADPGYLPAQRNYGRFLADIRKDLSSAESFLRSASMGNPKDVEAAILLAKVLERMGDSNGARECYEQMTQQHPTNISLLLSQAQFFQRMGDFDSAEKCHQKSLELEPENAKAHAAYSSFLIVARRDLIGAKRHMTIISRLLSKQ